MLALCKFQKWRKQVKVTKCWKLGDLMLKTVALLKFLKTEKLTENICACLFSLHPMQTPIHFGVSLVSPFSILNPQNFGPLLIFTVPALSISDNYKVPTSGFQLPQETWERSHLHYFGYCTFRKSTSYEKAAFIWRYYELPILLWYQQHKYLVLDPACSFLLVVLCWFSLNLSLIQKIFTIKTSFQNHPQNMFWFSNRIILRGNFTKWCIFQSFEDTNERTVHILKRSKFWSFLEKGAGKLLDKKKQLVNKSKVESRCKYLAPYTRCFKNVKYSKHNKL